jgi:predicted nucleic acid-binding protein
MSAKYFLDTNIFIYSFDRREPAKQARSAALIQEALRGAAGIISTQVVQEFLNVATTKFAVPLSLEDSQRYLRLVLDPLCQIYPDVSLFAAALRLQTESGYRFYDALIVAAAAQAGCDFLYSEDLQHERRIAGVTIINPFLTDAG